MLPLPERLLFLERELFPNLRQNQEKSKRAII
jgi:hypothetical protein